MEMVLRMLEYVLWLCVFPGITDLLFCLGTMFIWSQFEHFRLKNLQGFWFNLLLCALRIFFSHSEAAKDQQKQRYRDIETDETWAKTYTYLFKAFQLFFGDYRNNNKNRRCSSLYKSVYNQIYFLYTDQILAVFLGVVRVLHTLSCILCVYVYVQITKSFRLEVCA